MASARRIANGVQIWPNGSVNDFRHCASAVSARVGAGEAAQQALRRRPRQRIGRRRRAQAGGVGQRRDRIEGRGVTREAGEVGLVAELAAEDRAG